VPSSCNALNSRQTPRLRGPAFLLLAALVPFAGCSEEAAARRQRAEARILKRQIENLKDMIQSTSEKRLVRQEWLAVAVDEAAVKTVIEAGLPQEGEVADRFRVRVETAEVAFTSGSSLVRLRAHVVDEKTPGRQAEVIYQGGLDDIEVSADGLLRTRVLIDNVELAEGQEGRPDASGVASMAVKLAGQNLEILQGLIPDLSIPVRLQQNLAIEGLGDGPVQVDPGELPVNAAVARVLPLSGRLWVFLEVKVGPWRERPASPGQTG
jgi:hypothetical protein